MTAATGQKSGIAAALDRVGTGEAPTSLAERRQRQLALLPGLEGDQAADQVDQGDGPRGPGRPAGARNKRTQEWVDYLGGRYGTPLERLAQLYSANPGELAAAHGIKVIEALDIMKSAAIAALPYMHQKQPVSVDVTGKGRMVLVLGSVGEDDAERAAEDGLSMVLDLVAEPSEKSEGNSDV